MFRAYMGNLDSRVTEETLTSLLEERGLHATSVLIRRGYAFVDCPDQITLDKTIDELNGYNLMGSVMQVEPSTMSKRRRSNRVTIRNVPSHVSQDDVERLVATFGTVQKCELVSSTMESSVHVTYETPDQAQQAVDQLNNYEYQGSVLKVDYMTNGRQTRQRPRNSGIGNSRGTGYPLRILVPSDFVGAIIGRKGQTIRNITTQSRARVDVHGKENSGLLEKVISIYGQPENCTNACKEILKVMQQEADTVASRGPMPEDPSFMPPPPQQQQPPAGPTEITLKMLADDRYCGRIIGKEGKVIKKIREDTDTRITVSKNYSYAYYSVQEVPAMYPDRVITIKGTIDNMSSAESAISTKLRECYEKEMQAPVPPGMMMQPGLSGLPMMAGAGLYGMRPHYNVMQPSQSFYGGGGGQGMYSPGPGPQGGAMGGPPQAPPAPPTNEMCHIAVPNSSVGAIIGAGGSNIKQIIRDSSAFVTIEPKKDDDPNPAAERTVTIKGSQEAQWRASYFIFEKLKQEGFAGNDDVRLRTSVRVPKSMVGRVIGKGGKNVRDIQRMTGAMIKLPEDQANQGDETHVEIFGNFMGSQNAMSRVRALINQAMQGPPTTVPRRGPPRGPPPQN